MIDTSECIFCINMPIGEIMIYTFDIFDDPNISKRIAVESGELLKNAWLKDRFTMCGKSRVGLLAGAIYIRVMMNDLYTTQEEISDVLDITEVTLRNRFNTLRKILKPQYDHLEQRKRSKLKSHLVKCSDCENAPPIDAFNVEWDRRFGGISIRIYKKCRENKEVQIRLNTVSARRNCDHYKERNKSEYPSLWIKLSNLRDKTYWEIQNGVYEGEIIRK
jgi:hypothetical protein